MTIRIRHCVECPKCGTRYLVGFSPYGNGSYLMPVARMFWDEYSLYCTCKEPTVPSRWFMSEMKTCEVSREAHRRGYGSAEEIVAVSHESAATWVFDAGKYLDWKSKG